MPTTLVILNPHAGSGRAGSLWSAVEPVLRDGLGDLTLAITKRPEDVLTALEQVWETGLERVISVGGDGTNNSLVNALASIHDRKPDQPLPIFGTLPIGTGRDWARSVGVPFDIHAAARWIITAEPRPVDVGMLDCDGQRRCFLNIASAGLSGEVDRRVNSVASRRPWTFLVATVATIFSYQPITMRIVTDGETWYDGSTYVLAVANGTTFGHGMTIAPEASMTDGLFDVVLAEAMQRTRALNTLMKVYSGEHLAAPGVHHRRARQVEITGSAGPLDLDIDGEYTTGHRLRFSMRPGFLRVLLPPA